MIIIITSPSCCRRVPHDLSQCFCCWWGHLASAATPPKCCWFTFERFMLLLCNYHPLMIVALKNKITTDMLSTPPYFLFFFFGWMDGCSRQLFWFVRNKKKVMNLFCSLFSFCLSWEIKKKKKSRGRINEAARVSSGRKSKRGTGEEQSELLMLEGRAGLYFLTNSNAVLVVGAGLDRTAAAPAVFIIITGSCSFSPGCSSRRIWV